MKKNGEKQKLSFFSKMQVGKLWKLKEGTTTLTSSCSWEKKNTFEKFSISICVVPKENDDN